MMIKKILFIIGMFSVGISSICRPDPTCDACGSSCLRTCNIPANNTPEKFGTCLHTCVNKCNPNCYSQISPQLKQSKAPIKSPALKRKPLLKSTAFNNAKK